jgi:hypothetical protein
LFPPSFPPPSCVCVSRAQALQKPFDLEF